MDPSKKKYQVKKFRTKVTLTATTGEVHVVELVGAEPAVKELAQLIALGVDSKAAGLTREGIAATREVVINKAMGIIMRRH